MTKDLTVILQVDSSAPDVVEIATQIEEMLSGAGIDGEVLRTSGESSSQINHVMQAMNQADGEVIIVLNAALYQSVETIRDFYNPIRKGEADLVVGNRFPFGGCGLLRRAESFAARLLTRPIVQVKDPNSGLFAIRKSAFDGADNLDETCSATGLELLVKCNGLTVREVPVAANRPAERSVRSRFRFVRHLKRLYEYKLGSIAKPIQFIIVGSTGMVVDLICYMALLQVMPIHAARAIAIWLAMSWNFWLNRRITFSYARNRRLLPQYLLFCSSCLVGAVVNWFVSIGLYNSIDFFTSWPVAAAFCGVVAGTGFNYLFSLMVVFRKKRPPEVNSVQQPHDSTVTTEARVES